MDSILWTYVVTIFSLVEVHSQQTFPYVSFMDLTLDNHSYVDLSLVGNDVSGSDYVQCHTDLSTCCSSAQGAHRGDWYFPDEDKLSTDSGDIFEQRVAQRVDLRRRNSATSPTGLYRCDIQTNAVNDDTDISVRDTVYVGLYNTEGGDVEILSGHVVFEPNLLTLTCISTGGPATTVTWTRDSATVTEGTETVLNDPVTARYTHTLTITTVGDYNCTVSNNKPSSESANITVGGTEAPTNVTAVQDGLTSILVSWSPSSDATGYRIHYDSSGGDSGNMTVSSGSANSHTLTGLVNGQTYTISIVATSGNLPSERVMADMTVSLVPGQPTLSLGSTAATTASISWSIPNGSVVTRHFVQWQRNTSVGCPGVDQRNATLTGGSMTSYTIPDLEEDSEYSITVTASNDAGSSGVSNTVTAMTEEAAPSAPPPSVMVTGVTSSSITVQWGMVPCIHQNGDITDYSVQYRVMGTSGDPQTVTVNGASTTETTISNLMPSTTYSVQVAAVNDVNPGVLSASQSAMTRVATPVLQVGATAATSISVLWNSGGSEDVSYVVVWQRNTAVGCSDVDQNSTTLTGGSMISYTIPDLEEDSEYSITVTASNGAGSSRVSNTATAMTREAAPSRIPSVSVSNNSPFTITVQWGMVPCADQNGDITGYSVQYRVMGTSVDLQTKTVDGASATETTISNLMPSTTYSIQVAAVNEAGTGKFGDPRPQRTLDALILSINSVSTTSITIGWTLAEDVTANNFNVSHTNADCYSDMNSDTTSNMMYTLTGLEEGTEYLITVTATGIVVKYNITTTTNATAPSSPPSSVMVTGVTSSSITVQWGMVPCIHQNGDITGYSVQYRVMGTSGDPQTMMANGASTNETTISNLMPFTAYSIQVAAVNSAGTGTFSDVEVNETLPNVYLSLKGDVIPNNGYVLISDIGSTDDTALLCHTDRPPIPPSLANSGGEWFASDGTRVGSVGKSDVTGFERNRDPMVVRLRRTSGTPPGGIYNCTIDDVSSTTRTVYVGLYTSGGNITVSGDITFSLNSDLNGDSPQFTLTCISTGGPATTVTWTRDSTTVTEGTETVLDDATDANYTHTLNVTGRLPGLYICAVANDKPSEDSKQLMVHVASSVPNVMVTTSENTVTTAWSADDTVTGYRIYYHHRNENISDYNISGTEISHTFTEGASERVYTVSVQALSDHLPSSVVGPFTTRVPERVGEIAVAVEEGRLNISWQATPEPNDFSWNYTVSLTDNSTDDEILRRVQQMNITQIIDTPFPALAKGVPYTVSVFVNNGRGRSEVVSKLFFTEEDVPRRAPDGVEVERVNETHMRVSWSALSASDARGYLIHYTIHYWPASDRQRLMSRNTTATSEVIGGLVAGESYVVQVSATTAAGSGPNSTEVTLPSPSPEGPSSVVGPVVAGVVVAVVVVVVTIIIIIIVIRWRRSRRGPVKGKYRPPPPPKRRWGEKKEGKEKEEEVEMEDVGETSEDSDDSSSSVTARSDVPEAEFPEYVRLMHQNRDHRLELEYKSLDKLPQPASKAARLSCNVNHNRFKNIFPYDHSRVQLSGDPAEEGFDYINASFIDGYPDKKRAYIASQGPTELAVERFWEMVWEFKVLTIVMLTRCVEDGKEKCEQYWPDQTNTTEKKGKFEVTLTSSVPSAEYKIRKMQLKPTSEAEGEAEGELTVTHMYFTAWPDHGVPRNAMSLISFIRRVRREHPPSLSQPLLVHCSAGVGRTGTFILLDLAMQQMRREGTLSVFHHLKNMRTQRMKLVQTQTQYVFIHDSLSELVVCGETEMPAADIRIKMGRLQRPAAGDPTGLIGFHTQFQTLEEVSSQYQASYLEAQAKYNSGKNRFPSKLPNELGRVRLRHGPTPGSDYINASFIDGYKQGKTYIATQGPLEETVADLWRMVWENHCSCILMLCQTSEKGQESSHCFWPEEEAVYGKLRVGLKRESVHGDITERRLELSSWPPGELPHPTAILSLVDLLSKAQRSCPSRHTVIMCSDGVGRTGTFICLHSQLERLKTEGVVDFFQAVKSARIQRAGLVPDAAHYAFCHDVVANYLDSFETYANFKDVV